jgi:hypothetical protein
VIESVIIVLCQFSNFSAISWQEQVEPTLYRPPGASMLTITPPMQFSLIGNDSIRYKLYVVLFFFSRFDRGLGGTEITLRLRKYLAKLFNEQKKTKTDVFTNDRSMGKLFKEAEKLKKVLSANQYHYAQVL